MQSLLLDVLCEDAKLYYKTLTFRSQEIAETAEYFNLLCP
jgi:hypothetical protein